MKGNDRQLVTDRAVYEQLYTRVHVVGNKENSRKVIRGLRTKT